MRRAQPARSPTLVLGLAFVLALALALAPAASAGGVSSAYVDFESGPQGWSLNGWSGISPAGGNPGAHIHWNDFVDTFGMSARNTTHPAFVGDYTAKGPVTLSLDVQVGYITFFGSPVPRELVVMLFDDDEHLGAPPAAVWAHLGTLRGTGMDWTTYSATVVDVFSDDPPAGWMGAGDEDPKTFEPVLPPGRTWSNVLANVDRIEFATFVPGFFYLDTHFDLSIDNASIQPAGPSAWTDQGSALAGVSGDPALTGTGPATAGSFNTIALSNAAPSAPAGLFAGLSADPLPFKGGTLVPVPQVLVPLATGPGGTLSLPFHMPAGVPPGLELWMQMAIQDAAAMHGVALSNAVFGVVP